VIITFINLVRISLVMTVQMPKRVGKDKRCSCGLLWTTIEFSVATICIYTCISVNYNVAAVPRLCSHLGNLHITGWYDWTGREELADFQLSLQASNLTLGLCTVTWNIMYKLLSGPWGISSFFLIYSYY